MAKIVRAISVFSATSGNAGRRDGRELRHLRIVGARHAHHLGVRAAGANLHPVVLQQLDGDIAIGQQLDVVVKLARGNGACARLLHLHRGAGADRLVEIGRGDVQPVALGLDQKVRQNRNRGLALHHALRRGEFLHQFLAAYGNLHRCPLRGRLLHFCFHDRHSPTLALEARFRSLATLYNTLAASGSGCLFFFLIVFIRALTWAWKTGVASLDSVAPICWPASIAALGLP